MAVAVSWSFGHCRLQAALDRSHSHVIVPSFTVIKCRNLLAFPILCSLICRCVHMFDVLFGSIGLMALIYRESGGDLE